MNVLIGCPVYQREWILPYWFECIEKQYYPLDNIGFIFELAPDDNATHNILWDWQSKHPEISVFQPQIDYEGNHKSHPEGSRRWNTSRYSDMCRFRNNLLARATALSDQFDYYFSLDSDLLIEPNVISKLVEDCQDTNVHVVSPLSYMTPRDKAYPSIMYWDGTPGGTASRRHDLLRLNETYKVDIVMAAVFMTKPVFTTVRYQHHRQGEDLGFATALWANNFNSYVDTSLYANHVMHRADIKTYLTGFDIRKPEEINNAVITI